MNNSHDCTAKSNRYFFAEQSWISFPIFHDYSPINARIRRRLISKMARMRGASVASSLSPVRRRFVVVSPGSRAFSDFFRSFSSSEVTCERERASRVSYRQWESLCALSRAIVVIWRSGRYGEANAAIGNKCALSSNCDALVARKWSFSTYARRRKSRLRAFIVESESRVRTNRQSVKLLSNEDSSAESTLSESPNRRVTSATFEAIIVLDGVKTL